MVQQTSRRGTADCSACDPQKQNKTKKHSLVNTVYCTRARVLESWLLSSPMMLSVCMVLQCNIGKDQYMSNNAVVRIQLGAHALLGRSAADPWEHISSRFGP